MSGDDIFKDDDLTPEDEEFILADWDEDGDDEFAVDFETDDDDVLDFDEAVESVTAGGMGIGAAAKASEPVWEEPKLVDDDDDWAPTGLEEEVGRTALDGDEWGDEVDVPSLQEELPDAGWLEDAEPEVPEDADDLSDASLRAIPGDSETPDAFVFGRRPAAAGDDVESRGDGEVGASDRLEGVEEDMLFTGTGDRPEAFEGAEARTFSESGPPWGGEGLSLEDAVDNMTESPTIPTEREEDALHFDINAEDDVTLVDAEGDLQGTGYVSRAGAAGAYGYEESGPAFDAHGEYISDPEIDYSHDDFEASDTVEEEWAPVEERDDDEEYYEEEEEPEEEPRYGDAYEEPDYSKYEESYLDETDERQSHDAPRRSVLGWLAGIAALLALTASAGIWFLKPEWLGQDVVERVVQYVPIERPKTVLDLPVPRLAERAPDPVRPDPGTKDPVDPTPVKTDPVKSDPVKTDPVKKDPVSTDPVKKDPVQPDPGTKDPTPVKTDPKGPVIGAQDPVQQGDPAKKDPDPVVAQGDPQGTEDPTPSAGPMDQIVLDESGSYIGGQLESDEMKRHREQLVQETNGLVMGSTALAQMFNDSIFVGTVKMLNANFVTLKMKGGELTLQRNELRTLTPLVGPETEDWQKAASTGFIKLRNNNRLKGKIVESRDDAIILQVASNRVVVPITSIEAVSESGGTDVQMRENARIDSDDWFRRMVERKIAERKAQSAKNAGRIEDDKKPKVSAPVK